MAVISLKRSPWDWLFCTRSLPARSTKHREAADRHRNTCQDSHNRTQSDNRIIICSNLTSQPVLVADVQNADKTITFALDISPRVLSLNVKLEHRVRAGGVVVHVGPGCGSVLVGQCNQVTDLDEQSVKMDTLD